MHRFPSGKARAVAGLPASPARPSVSCTAVVASVGHYGHQTPATELQRKLRHAQGFRCIQTVEQGGQHGCNNGCVKLAPELHLIVPPG